MLDFGRRINGKTYYAGIAIFYLSFILLAIILNALPDHALLSTTLASLILVVVIVLFIYYLCLVRQRANDITMHPLLLLMLVFWTPLFLILGFFPGHKKANKFGPPPGKSLELRPKPKD